MNQHRLTRDDDGLDTKVPSFGRRDSLVRQASVERAQMEDLRRRSTVRWRRQLEERSKICRALIQRLNDEGVELLMRRFDVMGRKAPAPPLAHLKGATESVDFEMCREAADEKLSLSIVFRFKCDSQMALPVTIRNLIDSNIVIVHVETRPNEVNINELELLTACEGTRAAFLDALTRLTTTTMAANIERIELREIGEDDKGERAEDITLEEKDETDEDTQDASGHKSSTCRWYPRHVSELDMCAHVVVKYEPTQDPKHPGFADAEYIARRAELNKIANSYRFGETIPQVEYTELEHHTWRQAYDELRKLRASHTCTEYQENIARMEADGLITPDHIPQLATLSKYIQKRTGFELRPCGGLLSARDFLASLAFRVFQSTLYVRHHSRPNHCPEPDVIHEVLGHCPMFADPYMAQMSQEIGLLSLGATDEQIERLSTVYWFIVEFGLCRESGKLKAIGAGLISAFGELQHACSDVPRHEPFEPEVTALREYEDSDYQPLYFVAESIRDALVRLRDYASKLCPYYASIYAPLTRTVERMPLDELLRRKLDTMREDQRDVERIARQLLTTSEF